MSDERAETLQREQEVRETFAPPVEIGDPKAAASAEPVVEQSESTEAKTSEKEDIMVPKWRLDEVLSKLDEARKQPQGAKDNLDEVIDRKLAPLKVKIETQEVLAKYPDFAEFAPTALDQIKKNPALTLEQAYKLSKFDTVQSKAKEEGKKEAYQVIEKKTALQFEQTGRKSVPRPLDELVKDKTVPLSEIAKMLPRA